MKETSDFWIVNDKFIFKPRFNNDIESYLELISKCNTLIFSDYEVYYVYTNVTCHNYYHNNSCFNRKISIPNNIKILIFGHSFNKQIKLPKLLTHLTLGFNFNQIIKLPKSLTHLTFCGNYNKMINIPHTIYCLKLNYNNTHIIDYLPFGIEQIELYHHFDLPLDNLPSSIKSIIFNSSNKYNRELNCLPKYLEYLKLPMYYDKKISNIPYGLKKICCSKKYKYINDFLNYQLTTY